MQCRSGRSGGTPKLRERARTCLSKLRYIANFDWRGLGPMLKIGLTGGIGSGKTRVADYFQAWGASVVDTDAIAHSLTAPGGRAIGPIRREFGAAMIDASGALDRNAMRALVFDDPAARARLEAILHPMIGEVTREQARRAEGC